MFRGHGFFEFSAWDVVRDVAATGYFQGVCQQAPYYSRRLCDRLSEPYDCLRSERTLLSDKRLSLEAAIIRQSLSENLGIHWVSAEQQLADCLTKTLGKKGLNYIQQVLADNTCMLGPDSRIVIKCLPEEKAGKIATYAESQAANGDYTKRMSSGAGTTTILVATLASCFTSAEGSVDDEGHHVLPARDWLMIVMVSRS